MASELKNADKTIKMPDKAFGINCSEDSFFKYWLEFLKPFHKLANKEILVLAELLKQREILSKAIKDDELIDKVLMSRETLSKVSKNCGMTPTYFHVILGKLRKSVAIEDNRINKKFIPSNYTENTFKLMLIFNIKSND